MDPQIEYEHNFPRLRSSQNYIREQQHAKDFLETSTLIKELNSLINVKEINRALQDLINILMDAEPGKQSFEQYYRFMYNIEEKYAINH